MMMMMAKRQSNDSTKDLCPPPPLDDRQACLATPQDCESFLLTKEHYALVEIEMLKEGLAILGCEAPFCQGKQRDVSSVELGQGLLGLLALELLCPPKDG